MTPTDDIQFRDATVDDQPAIIELINGVYEEYGERMCLEGADADLLDLEGAYVKRGGAFIVAVQQGVIVGSHATLPIDPQAGLLTFRRLYTAPATRGTGLGQQLMQWAFDWSVEHGFRRVEFWSDTRFTRAHAFFAKLGFEKGGTRRMADGYEPYEEYQFTRELL